MTTDTKFKPKDYAGKKYGLITPIKKTLRQAKDSSYYWLVECDCGIIFNLPASRLARIYSCGCIARPNSGQQPPTDLSNYKSHKAKALYPTKKRSPSGYVVWKLYCNCGTFFERPARALIMMSVHSCGCRYFNNKGRKPIPNSASHVNLLYGHYKYSAKTRKLEFTISKELARKLFESNCTYCGIEPTITYTNENLSGAYAWNGIDRVDSFQGYIPSNVVPCCTTCNLAKSNKSLQEFKAWIKRLIAHSHQ